jgi:hypothetical protein
MPMTPLDVLDLIFRAVKKADLPEVVEVTQDNDNDDGEIILTVRSRQKTSQWVIRSRQIEPLNG